MSEAVPVISEEVQATPPKTRALKWTVSVIAIAMSLFHMYVAGFGPPEAMVFRGVHLLFALTLIFLLYPLKPGGGIGWRMLDMVLLIGSWAFILHIFFNYEYVTYRTIYIDDMTSFDMIYAVISLTDRPRGNQARPRLGAADHRSRLPRLHVSSSPT